MAETAGAAGATDSRTALLGIYLNDHLAGATGGVELFRRAAGAHRGTPLGDILEELLVEVTEDREALIEIMRTLGVPVRHYKVYAGWAVEKVARLKLNGQIIGRSPLSTLVELEAMRLGVEGKAAGWRVLRVTAEQDARLDPARPDGLLARARRQADVLQELHATTAAEIFGPGTPQAPGEP
jgi:hypothetical protein